MITMNSPAKATSTRIAGCVSAHNPVTATTAVVVSRKIHDTTRTTRS